MSTGVYDQLTSERQVDVSTIAGIVEEMVTANPSVQRSPLWLEEHYAAAGLSAEERGALETLRSRLGDSDLVDSVTTTQWY